MLAWQLLRHLQTPFANVADAISFTLRNNFLTAVPLHCDVY